MNMYELYKFENETDVMGASIGEDLFEETILKAMVAGEEGNTMAEIECLDRHPMLRFVLETTVCRGGKTFEELDAAPGVSPWGSTGRSQIYRFRYLAREMEVPEALADQLFVTIQEVGMMPDSESMENTCLVRPAVVRDMYGAVYTEGVGENAHAFWLIDPETDEPAKEFFTVEGNGKKFFSSLEHSVQKHGFEKVIETFESFRHLDSPVLDLNEVILEEEGYELYPEEEPTDYEPDLDSALDAPERDYRVDLSSRFGLVHDPKAPKPRLWKYSQGKDVRAFLFWLEKEFNPLQHGKVLDTIVEADRCVRQLALLYAEWKSRDYTFNGERHRLNKQSKIARQITEVFRTNKTATRVAWTVVRSHTAMLARRRCAVLRQRGRNAVVSRDGNGKPVAVSLDAMAVDCAILRDVLSGNLGGKDLKDAVAFATEAGELTPQQVDCIWQAWRLKKAMFYCLQKGRQSLALKDNPLYQRMLNLEIGGRALYEAVQEVELSFVQRQLLWAAWREVKEAFNAKQAAKMPSLQVSKEEDDSLMAFIDAQG